MKNFLLLLPVLVCFASCSPDQAEKTDNPAPEPKEYLIAYNVHNPDSLHEDNYDIFTMELDGSNKRNITNHPDVAWTYHASGERIFFVSDRDTCYRCYFLYEMDGNGGNLRRIGGPRLRDNWMGSRKGGEEIIVSPHFGVDTLAWVIDRQGNLIQKFNSGMPYTSDPAFSPDGQRVAFVGQNKRSKRDSGYVAEIYVAKLDGTELLQISQYPEDDTTAPWYAYKAGPPKWHPGGEFVSFQSYQNGKYSLFATNIDGSKQWKISQDERQEGWHDWSPDGKWLAIELFDSAQAQFHIGLMDWETKELKILTDTSFKYQQSPVFVEKPRSK